MTGTPVGNSVVASANAVAPAASGTVATISAANLGAGLWNIAIQVGYGATAGLDDDFQVLVGGTIVFAMRAPASINQIGPIQEFARTLISTDQIVVRATVGGVASSVYKATIVATPIKG